MYVKRSFAMTDDESLALLQRVGVANLVSTTPAGLTATLLPFVCERAEDGTVRLLSHMMRVNTQWRDSRDDVLVIADGLSHHVTADWLPAGGRIPTWNYETVHAHGELIVHDDIDFCRDVVSRTVAAHEETWRVENGGEDIEPMLRAIVGIEVRVTRVEGKAKLAQNRHPDVISSIIDGLEAKGLHADAEALRTRSLPVARARQELVDDARRRRVSPEGADGGRI